MNEIKKLFTHEELLELFDTYEALKDPMCVELLGKQVLGIEDEIHIICYDILNKLINNADTKSISTYDLITAYYQLKYQRFILERLPGNKKTLNHIEKKSTKLIADIMRERNYK